MAGLSSIFHTGVDILKTVVSDKAKTILAQIGNINGQGLTDSDNVEWIQHDGFASRPAKAEIGKAASQGYGFSAGGTDYIVASKDIRGQAIYGKLGDGETCLFAIGPDGTAQGRILIKGDGSINLFTTEGNADGGKSMGIFVNPDGSVTVASSKGNAVLLKSDGAVNVFNGSGSIQILADGHVKIASGSKVEVSGASITLGGAAALPLAIGPQTVTAITALQTQITALQIECAAIAGALVAAFNIVGPILPPHAAAAAAATTAVGVGAGAVVAGTAGVAAASALIPTLRTSAD